MPKVGWSKVSDLSQGQVRSNLVYFGKIAVFGVKKRIISECTWPFKFGSDQLY